MHILVGIPSLNEADSIAHVTEQIDKGLKLTFGCHDCTIVNIDSDSVDRTSEKFQATTTWARKMSIVLRQRPLGKGRNLLKFFRYAEEQQADGVATFDADVTSIQPEWVEALLAPIISKHADYVVPCYRRSRFEGSTTNHFAFPLMYGFCGIDVRQPIAGDFGVGMRVIKELFSRPITLDILGYGIDMALSMTAGTAGLRISEVQLGDKQHKPSFGKIEKIFKEEAAGGLEIIRRWLPSQRVVSSKERPSSIADWGNYSHYHEAISLVKRLSAQIPNLIPTYSADNFSDANC
jgi:glycosyltransferase involved in cell wall biosynthesis